MRNPIEVLKHLSEKSHEPMYKFQRLYRNLYNPEFYWLAYRNIYANKGSMTPGADGTTMDGIEVNKYEEIVHHYADMRVPLDLDDGVKVNYSKLGGLLTKVK